MPVSTILQTKTPRPAGLPEWPTMYDLPSEEVGDPGMPDEFHVHQTILLDETFRLPREDYFSALDMNLYYDRQHPRWYKRPDWMGVIGVPRLYAGYDMRYSYVVWDEGVLPLIVVELLSDSTEDGDLGQRLRDARKTPSKWEVYERLVRVPYYAIFSRNYTELRFFRLTSRGYEEDLLHEGRVWLPEAEIGLGLWQGSYHGFEKLWLRWYDADGNWLLTGDERAEQERQRAEQQFWRAEQEQHRAEQERRLAVQASQRADQADQRAAQAEQRAASQRPIFCALQT